MMMRVTSGGVVLCGGMLQVNVRSVNRQKYACLFVSSQDPPDDTDSVRISSVIAWGSNALFAVEFIDGGRYAIRTSDDRYIQRDGSLVTGPPPMDASFTVELKVCYTLLSLANNE